MTYGVFVPVGTKEPQRVPSDFDIGFVVRKVPDYIGEVMVSVYRSAQGVKVLKLVYGKGVEPIGEAGLSEREVARVVRSEAFRTLLS